MATMNLKQYAAHMGISEKTARRWYQAGTLPHPAQRAGRLILVDVPDDPQPQTAYPQRTALYVDSTFTSASEIKEWALEHGMRIDETHREQPSLDSSSTILKQLLANPAITRIITDSHPDADLLSAALSAQGREFITALPTRHAARTFKPRIASSAGA